MTYDQLTPSEKKLYKRINRTHTYSQLQSECLHWLTMSSNYDGTREGLYLFMEINDIPQGMQVPSKRSLILCLMLMYAQDFCEQQAQLITPEFINKASAALFLEECLAIEL